MIEAGTPLIKKYGLKIIRNIRREIGDAFVIADLKTLDVGRLEARLAYEESADGAVVSGLAPRQTVEEFLRESESLHMWSIIDMMAVYDPLKVLKSIDILPDIVILHRGIDEEAQRTLSLPLIKVLKKKVDRHLLVGIAGGIDFSAAETALSSGADVLIIGRYVTASRDPGKVTKELLSLIER
jgi:bifunctional enzyme Fae/Hps